MKHPHDLADVAPLVNAVCGPKACQFLAEIGSGHREREASPVRRRCGR